MSGKRYIVFGGQVRAIDTYETRSDAELHRGGVPCWIITGRSRRGDHGCGYEVLIAPAVRREERSGRQFFIWTDENGLENSGCGLQKEAFDTFEQARATLISRAEKRLASALETVKMQRAELRKARAIKPLKPGKAPY